MSEPAAPGPSTPGGEDPVVVTSGAAKRYGRGAVAVTGLDLVIRRGEIFALLGHNGAGKSTTIKLLTGLVRPTRGTLRVLGRPPGHPAGLRRIGVLREDPPLYPFLTGEEHLTWAAHCDGASRARVPLVLALVDLESAKGKKASTYSMGMRQRLGLALALLNDPDLLILDEPTNGLDPQGIADFRGLLEGLRAEGKTVLLSSHLLSEVERVSDRIAVMRAGRIVVSSDLASLRGKPRVVVRAAPLNDAAAVASAARNVTVLSLDASALRLEMAHEDVPGLVRDLVLSGIDVVEVRHETPSVESVVLPLLDQGSAT